VRSGWIFINLYQSYVMLLSDLRYLVSLFMAWSAVTMMPSSAMSLTMPWSVAVAVGSVEGGVAFLP
jgi:hypothetical protein